MFGEFEPGQALTAKFHAANGMPIVCSGQASLPAVESGFPARRKNLTLPEWLEIFRESSTNSVTIPGGKMPPSTSGKMPDATFPVRFARSAVTIE